MKKLVKLSTLNGSSLFALTLMLLFGVSSCDKAEISSIQNAGMKLDYRLDNIPNKIS